MTTTQVRFWEYREGKRHNLATEKETKRHDVATENLTASDLSERKRHNLMTEKLTVYDLKEKARHNVATENLTATQIAEQIRHNQATEALTATQIANDYALRSRQIATQERANDIRADQVAETKRHNEMEEYVKKRNLSVTIDKIASEIRSNEYKNLEQLTRAWKNTGKFSSYLGVGDLLSYMYSHDLISADQYSNFQMGRPGL